MKLCASMLTVLLVASVDSKALKGSHASDDNKVDPRMGMFDAMLKGMIATSQQVGKLGSQAAQLNADGSVVEPKKSKSLIKREKKVGKLKSHADRLDWQGENVGASLLQESAESQGPDAIKDEEDADDEEKDEESSLEENDEGNEEDEGSLMSDDAASQVRSCQGDDPSRRRSGKSCQVLAGLRNGTLTKNGQAHNMCRSNAKGYSGRLGKEARYTCCKTCQTAPMQAIFGGDQRGAGSDKKGRMKLPEDIRAQQCTLDKCQECGSQDNCFQAVSQKTRKGQKVGHPYSKLSVQEGLSFTSYRVSFYAKCDAGDLAKIDIRIIAMRNGRAEIFMDGIHKKTLTSVKHGIFKESLATNGDAFQLSVEFFPANPMKRSKVLVSAQLGNVRPKFEQCMDHKTCLTVMGNMKLKASYALRNKNAYQLSCLRGATLPSWLNATCEAWRSCVEENPSLAKYLQTSLSAANPSMLQIEATSATKANRQDECLDPAIADAEALECECMVFLQEKCGDDEECFKSTYCEDNRVCQDWKDANGCPQSLLQVESNSLALAAKRRSLHNESSSSANILTDNLESALQGKCASQ